MSTLSNFTLLFFTFPTCSFPLPLSCVFQSLVHSRSTGERDMFAHSLSRRGWHHNEQICSCKVNPTEGNCGLFVGVCGARWGPHGPPIYNCYISFTCAYSKWWQMLSHCCFLSPWVKKAMLILTHRVSLQSLKKKRNVLMYCYISRKTGALNHVKAVDCCKTSSFSPLLKFGPHSCCVSVWRRANL